MASIDLNYGIPNVELCSAAGTKINPSYFAGHELVALFCPLDADAAIKEIEAYRRHSTEFVERDAWLLAFADHNLDASVDGLARVLTIPDGDRRAWVAFRNLTHHPDEMDRTSGGTFLFTRGGCLNRYWHGNGHVDEVLKELRAPSSQQ